MAKRFPYEYEHSIGATLDYSLDWNQGAWLTPGEVIIGSSWVTVDVGATITNQQIASGVTSAFIYLNTPNAVFDITNTITTNQGRTDSRTISLSCKRR